MKRYLIVGGVFLAMVALFTAIQIARVPDVIGTYADARTALTDAGFRVVVVDAAGRTREPHDLELVTDQSPAAGTFRAFGDTVTLRTRPPRARVVMPDVLGRRLPDAERIVHDAGLVFPIAGLPDEAVVASTVPSAGQTLDFGSAVLFTVRQ